MANSLITLRFGPMMLELDPPVGGSIANFIWEGDGVRAPILRESRDPLRSVLDAACFPLVPFCNRIRGGCFEFRGRTVRLSPNMPGDPSPLHGQGWISAWTAEEQSDTEAVLRFGHPPGEWPWAYEASQHFRLAGDSLWLRIGCRNASDEPMPCGLGFHPYFPCGPGTLIQTFVDEVWTVDEQVLPVERTTPSGRYDITDSPICGRRLDNGYGGWCGRALFTDPSWPFEIELSSRDARFFQVYSPESGGFFVAEPVSHANCALNEPQPMWAALGIQILQPGEEMDLEARIQVQPK